MNRNKQGDDSSCRAEATVFAISAMKTVCEGTGRGLCSILSRKLVTEHEREKKW